MHLIHIISLTDDDEDDLGGELIEAKNSRELNSFKFHYDITYINLIRKMPIEVNTHRIEI